MRNTYICFSGASTKIGFHLGAGLALQDELGKENLHYVGTSSGAVIAFVLACNAEKKAIDLLKKLKFTDFMTDDPTSYKGQLMIASRILCKDSIFDQTKLISTIKKVVSLEVFTAAQLQGKQCWVHYTDEQRHSEHVIDVMTLNYEVALRYILASGSICPLTASVMIDGKSLMDGGHKSHAGTHLVMEMFKGTYYTVYSRTDNVDTVWGLPKKGLFKLAILKRYFNMQNILVRETSEKAEVLADEIAEDDHAITHNKVFTLVGRGSDNGEFYEIHDQMVLMREGKDQVISFFNE